MPTASGDLRGPRVRIGKLVGDGFGAHVHASIGASSIVLPNGAPTSFGAAAGFGVGVSHSVERTAFVTLERAVRLCRIRHSTADLMRGGSEVL